MTRERASAGKAEGSGKATSPGRPGRGRGRESARGLDLQDALGNRAVGRMLGGRAAPLSVTPASGTIQRKCAACSGGGPPCPTCQEEAPIQRKARPGGDSAAGGGGGPVRSSGSGRPLDSGTRGFMASRFGHDFDGVRVHTDGQAASSADRLRAHAFTVGQDIYFGAGRYRPDTHEGRHLLAHELTHTLQQRAGGSGGGSAQASRAVSQPGDPLEREADAAADRVLSGAAGGFVPSPAGPSRPIQRYSAEEFLHDASGVVSDAGDVISAAGDVVADTASDVVDKVGQAVDTARDVADEAVDTAVDLGGRAVDVALDTASAFLDDARALASALGGMVSITSAGLVIDVPPMPVCPVIPLRFNLPEIGKDLPFLAGAFPITENVLIYGEVGLHAGITPEVSLQLGPCFLHGLHIVINPLTGSYSASGGLTAMLVAGLGGEARVGLYGEVGVDILWPDPPIAIQIPVARVEAGLAGFARGMVADTVTVAGSLAYAGGSLSLSLHQAEILGLAADLGLAGYGGLEVLGMNLCTLYWPLAEWHDDVVLTSSLDVDLMAGIGGLSLDIDYQLPTLSPLEFADLPVALRRDVLNDDCPICDVMYALGLFPSQIGGPWPFHPGPPLPGPLEAYPVDPGITSKSLCRGACGPNCNTCDVEPEVYVCEDTGDDHHVLWKYTDYNDCPTHKGCRDHDACYDWCADHGEMGIWGPCHRVCDLECLCGHGAPECVGWIVGTGGDDRMAFAEDSEIVGGCRGRCEDMTIDDKGGITLCLPDLTLFEPLSRSTGYVHNTDEIVVATVTIPVPYLGEIPIDIAVGATVRASLGGTLGPGLLSNMCLTVDPSAGTYRGTADMHVLADLAGGVSLTGRVILIPGKHCLVDFLRFTGSLTAGAELLLRNDLSLATAAGVNCNGGEIELDARVALDTCLKLIGTLTAGLDITLFDFELFSDTWKLGSTSWGKCWEIEIAAFSTTLGGGSNGAGGALGGLAGALGGGTAGALGGGAGLGSVDLTSTMLDETSLITGLFNLASSNKVSPPIPSNPASAAGKPQPKCGTKPPQCGQVPLKTPSGDVTPTKGLFAGQKIHYEQRSGKHTRVADCPVADLQAAAATGDPTKFVGELSTFVAKCKAGDVTYGSQLSSEAYSQYEDLVRLALETVLTEDDFNNKPIRRSAGQQIGMTMQRGKDCAVSTNYEVKDPHPDPKISAAHIFPVK